MFYRVPPQENEVAYTQQYPIENLYDRVQNMIVQLLEKTNGQGGAAAENSDSYDDSADIGSMMV